MQVQARLLPYPTLTYADTSRRTDKSGQWNPAKFYRPGNMDSYAFASFTHPVAAQNLKVRSDWGAILEQGASWRPASPTFVSCHIISVAQLHAFACARSPEAPTGAALTGAQQPPPLPRAAGLFCLPACASPRISRCEVALGLSLWPYHSAAVALLNRA